MIVRSTIVLMCLAFGNLFAQEDNFRKGDDLFAKGKYAESIESYTKAIEVDPENINAYIQRGMAYSITKDYQKAVADYSLVLQRNPDMINVKNSRGSAFLKLKMYDEAFADFNDIINADPGNQEAYNNRGWCKKYLGDQEGACEDWKQSKKLGNAEAKIILKNNGC
jgi:tetratricopeptide (TPR) repeat protein